MKGLDKEQFFFFNVHDRVCLVSDCRCLPMKIIRCAVDGRKGRTCAAVNMGGPNDRIVLLGSDCS
jgi:hypothetical protein